MISFRPAFRAGSGPRIFLPATGALLLSLVMLSLLPASALAQPGEITGRITGGRGKTPLAFTNVMVVGTPYGAVSDEDGRYTIRDLPPGHYVVQASFIGYEVVRQEIDLEARHSVRLDFQLVETVAGREKEVVVTAERPLVDVKKASTTRTLTDEDLGSLTLSPTLDSAVEQQPGVTRDNNEIHIRGGRSDETLYIVDGVKMRDVISGESRGNTVSARSVAEVNIITGGFDAKYGQALSGIVEAQLKEGGQHYQGYVGYTTDRAGTDRQTDLWGLQLGGPLRAFPGALRALGIDRPGSATFFLDFAADLGNDYLPTISDFTVDPDLRRAVGDITAVRRRLRSSYRDSFLGHSFTYGDFFYPRAENQWRLLFKTTWKASPSHKFDISLTKNLSFDQGFGESDIGSVDRNTSNYAWAWSRRFDRYYTVSRDENSFSLAWNHTISKSLVHTLKLTRYFSARHQDVGGYLWSDYRAHGDSLGTDSAIPDSTLDTPYFRDLGWAPDYSDRFSEIWGLDWEWRHRRGRHDIGWGVQAEYQNVQYFSMDVSTYVPPDTATGNPGKPLGDEYDLFHVYPNTGAFYLQDRMEYQDLIASIGLRYDYWFPGEQVEHLYDRADRPTITAETRREFYNDTHGLFGHRFKGHLSPRIQVSHPITDRDHLFFNYGHFSQRPAYFYVYTKSGSISSEEFPRIGNPNLNPEISVQYELGAGHQFRKDMSAKLSLFYKDIYDYPTSVRLTMGERQTRRSDFFVYQNMDYSRSLGFEIELRKRRTRHFSGALAYSYSVAKGKNSDPNALSLVQESGGDARETYLEEVYMWWNRPHKLTLWVDYRVDRGGSRPNLLGLPVPRDFGLNLYYLIRSGRPYTPTDRFGNQTGQTYSRNGPFDSTLNGKITKGFRLGSGRRLEIVLEAWNLFDHRTPLYVDPVTGRAYEPGKGSLDSPSEDPANLHDPRYARSVAATIAQYSDPSLRSAPRSIRLGMGMEF